METSLLNWIDRFPNAQILVAGEVGIDEYVFGQCRRISPEAPVPIVEVDSQEIRLGLSANVAQNIVSLGARALLVTVRGEDADGEKIESLLKQSGIESYFVNDSSRPTSRKVRVISQKQHLVRIDYEKTHFLVEKKSKEFSDLVVRHLKDCDALLIQDYGKGLWNLHTMGLIREARRHNKPVYVDPNRNTSIKTYEGATLLTPNISEAEALCGVTNSNSRVLGFDLDKLRVLAEFILKSTGADHSLITCGEWGMVGFEKSTGVFRKIDTFAREVFDVTGAGDTVIAVMAVMHCQGAPIEVCMRMANLAAGLVVGRLGASSVTPAELVAEVGRLRFNERIHGSS